MGRAILKHGPEAFSVDHIASAIDVVGLKKLERELIAQENTKMPNGFNLTGGGDGMFDPPQEILDKLSASLKGHIHSTETRAKIGEASRNRDPEMWIRVSNKLRGRKTGRAAPIEAIEALRTLNKSRTGIKLSEEHRRNISVAQTGKKRPEGTGAKISAAKLGKPRSEATKAKLRAHWRAKEEDIYIPEPLAKEIMAWLGLV
jgi:hypothetical protein